MNNQEKTQAAIIAHPEWSALKLAAFLGTSRSGVQKILRALQASGQLRRAGSRKGGRWELVELGSAPAGTPGPAIPDDDQVWIPEAPQEIEAMLDQVMEAVDAAYQGYLAAWDRQDPEAERLRQRQKQLGRVASRLQAARLRQLGAGLGKQSAQFQAANARLQQSVVQLQDSVQRTGRVIDVAARIDQLLELTLKTMK
jgi:predicted ArsR family transcriptional regulator